MAAPKKKRDVEEMDQSDSDEFDDDDLDDSYSEGDEDEDMLMTGEVMVDFEAMQPCDSDYDGIRALLNQLYLKENINISQLAETIISQNYVGCIIKQGEVPEEEDSDEEVEDDPVFGVMSIINMSERKDLECVKQIKQMILTHCEESAADKLQEFKQLFADENKQIGYLLHERFINIPPAIAVPMYDSLKKDLESEKVQKMKYKFDQFIFICKTCRPMEEGSKNTPIDINQIMFLNAEEEVLIEFAKSNFSYSVASQKDTVVDGGEWEDELETLRTVIIIDSNKIDSAAAKMKSLIGKS